MLAYKGIYNGGDVNECTKYVMAVSYTHLDVYKRQ